ncbi:MAG: hypothetical protein JNK85_00895 [Verrucomicrobiales bacterium]|nr:hypothetical protein [Verrucomicrobiales bacterium]
MKPRHALIGLTAAVLSVAGFMFYGLHEQHSNLTGTVDVRFIGFSVGQPNTFTSALPIHYHAFIRDWLSSGTNEALFTVTNGQTRSLRLYPYAGFLQRTNDIRSHYETVLTTSENGYGILLRAGEAATVKVAILPQGGPGFVRFGYSPDYRDPISRLLAECRALITHRKRATFQNDWIYSEVTVP